VQLLQPIVDEVLALVRVTLPPGASLFTEVAAKPMHVLADPTQLHQVLLNLCTNAWQALQGRAGVVTVGLARVEFDADSVLKPAELAPGPHAHLWVSDTGCGIDAAVRQRIFEPFFTTKGVNGGTGLGLSVVHGIVLAHHGAIAVRSRVGEGSTFEVYLPLHAAPPPDVAEAHGASDAATHRGEGQHVLYVDDDPVMGLLVERLLERAGYRVSSHSSAHAALQAVQAQPAAYDVVVTDFNMPEMSGLEVSRTLAELSPDLPVLIMSGYVFEEMPAQALRAGVREIIRKQHVMEELVPAVARVLAGATPRA
jgi:CheY-like chemotaxis protein